jgi:hypothetical protein
VSFDVWLFVGMNVPLCVSEQLGAAGILSLCQVTFLDAWNELDERLLVLRHKEQMICFDGDMLVSSLLYKHCFVQAQPLMLLFGSMVLRYINHLDWVREAAQVQ